LVSRTATAATGEISPAREPDSQVEPRGGWAGEEAVVVTSPPQPPEPEPAEREELPPVPQISKALLWISERFSLIFASSVLVGLIGQIVGFGVIFGANLESISGVAGIIGACGMGGLFELTMVTSSATAFRKIAEGLGWWEISFYLVISIGSLAVAAYMSFAHWSEINDYMALPFGGLTIVGFVCHFVAHIFPALRIRRALQAHEEAKRRLAEEARRRREEDRKRQEEYQRKLDEQERQEREKAQRQAEQQQQEQQRRKRLEDARQQAKELAATAEETATKRVRKGTQASIEVARAFVVYHRCTSPTELFQLLQGQGYAVKKATVDHWWKRGNVDGRLRDLADALSA